MVELNIQLATYSTFLAVFEALYEARFVVECRWGKMKFWAKQEEKKKEQAMTGTMGSRGIEPPPSTCILFFRIPTSGARAAGFQGFFNLHSSRVESMNLKKAIAREQEKQWKTPDMGPSGVEPPPSTCILYGNTYKWCSVCLRTRYWLYSKAAESVVPGAPADPYLPVFEALYERTRLLLGGKNNLRNLAVQDHEIRVFGSGKILRDGFSVIIPQERHEKQKTGRNHWIQQEQTISTDNPRSIKLIRIAIRINHAGP
ncbi:hypothetical protein C8R43DRAFT_946206 [Mycena crocata]|nr:hypothetical protein C8R43DRAFT_946206 [Mycena crocata]